MAPSPRRTPRRSGPLQYRAASVELTSGSDADGRSFPDGLPGGWVDLQMLLTQYDEDTVVLDCVVWQVGQPGSGKPARLHVGKPISVRINAPLGTEERRELETWLDQDPDIAVLTDDHGCLLLLSVDQRSIALELHAH